MHSVRCYGPENTLFQCSHRYNHNCDHSEDAGVVCQPCELVYYTTSLKKFRDGISLYIVITVPCFFAFVAAVPTFLFLLTCSLVFVW